MTKLGFILGVVYPNQLAPGSHRSPTVDSDSVESRGLVCFTNMGTCASACGDPPFPFPFPFPAPLPFPGPTTDEERFGEAPPPSVGEITPMIEIECAEVLLGIYGLGGGLLGCSAVGLLRPLFPEWTKVGLCTVGEPTEGGGGDRGTFMFAGFVSSRPGLRSSSISNSSVIGRGGGRSTIASRSCEDL
jgi:hypothetical protein